MDLLAQLDLLGVKSPYSFGLLIYAFSIQNFENLLQKMTFSYCYIGYICHTFQIALLQTSMIFGGLGAVELLLDLLLDHFCPPIASGPLLYEFSIQNFEILLKK